ncbi:MAG: HU family DNA-binding protein [Prevotellaceae bacterium]|jgi:predicted histone-like DNA-binding protein|nr:HU family DNA-binding protein [Prevotellaceae bacterium]
MSIFYNKVERANPQNRTAPKKWYPSLKTIEQIGEKEVARQISDETTLNPKEAEMALDQFRKVLVRNLLDSKSVQLGDWGAFHLTCSGEGSATRDEVSGAKIKKLNVQFTLGKELQDALAGATFKAAESIVG